MAEEKGESETRRSHKKSEMQNQDVEENGYEEEPDFSDPEGFVDDVTDEGNGGDLTYRIAICVASGKCPALCGFVHDTERNDSSQRVF